MKKYIVYYCYLVTKYEQLIDNQFQRLIDSGLYNEVENIFVNIYGDEELVEKQIQYFNKYNKVIINNINTEVNTYEYEGLKCVWDLAQKLNDDDLILYFHTKGITRNCSYDMELWRNVMEYELIDKYKEVINLFNDKPLSCGVNLKAYPKYHFSGNFWWANVKYLKNLVQPKLIIDDIYVSMGITNRHYYEFWISHFNESDFRNNMKNLKTYNVNYNVFNEFNFLNHKYFVKLNILK